MSLTTLLRSVRSVFARGWDRLLTSMFPRVSAYEFTAKTLRSMHGLAWTTHPKEMFALLHGKRRGTTLVIDTLIFQPFSNTRRSASASIDSALTDVIGSFHTHPGGDPRPSAADIRMFSKSPGIHCILPEPYEELSVYSHHGRLLGVERIAVNSASLGSRRRR